LERIRKLEEEMTRLKAWDAEKQRYQLTEIGPGVVAFVLKEGMSQGEPPHQICANCCANGKKSYLQRHLSGPSLERLKCNTCGESIDINRPPPPGDHNGGLADQSPGGKVGYSGRVGESSQ